jgi:hypothetical protein
MRLDEVRETSKARRRIVMKKLLAIVLVLGMASMASAALTLSLDGTTVSVISDGGEPATTIFVGSSTVDLAIGGLGTEAGDGTARFGGGGADAGIGATFGLVGQAWTVASFSGALPAGQQIAFQTTGAGVVEMYDAFGGTLMDSVTIPVPEPITMSLLGLGGLVALRRRRA